MPRRSDLKKFYKLMSRLERNIGGKRVLGDCDGKMNWPKRGVYFFYGDGEKRTGSGKGDRIVRVGSHALRRGEKTTLWSRLDKHRGTDQPSQRRRGSVFRNLVGNAVCRRDHSLGPKKWPRDGQLGNAAQVQALISDHIWPMTLIFLPVRGRCQRDYIERNSIGLLSEYGEENPIDPSTGRWLGHDCDRGKVRESGLWQSNHVGRKHEPEFLTKLETLVDQADDYS